MSNRLYSMAGDEVVLAKQASFFLFFNPGSIVLLAKALQLMALFS